MHPRQEKSTHYRHNLRHFTVIRQLGIAALLTILGDSALADECQSAIAEAYTATRDTYRASQDAYQEAASDAKVAALVRKMVGEGRMPGASAAAKESADAVNAAMEAARTATASLQVASNIRSRAAVEKAVDAALNASIAAENAFTIAKENSWQETGWVLRKVSRTVLLARTAARAASDAAQVCD